MRVFLAGASGVIGRRLVPLLVRAGHQVTGTTRSAEKAELLRSLGAEPVVLDVFDAAAVARAVQDANPEAIIHQLTDLPFAPGTPRYAEGLERNAQLRIDGTRNLASAAKAVGVRRMISQSIAFVYAPKQGPLTEDDPLAPAEGAFARTMEGVKALEEPTLAMPEGIVLRYGLLYGPGTWSPETPIRPPSVHVDAAGQAALLALTKGQPGIYNIAEDDPDLSSDKAKRELGFDAGFRF
jgi:nucleoside-diphosphate-sugar epimerase